MTELATVTWGSAPGIPIVFSYEHRRSGADMQYRVTVQVQPVTGNRYFGYPIYLEVSLDGVQQLSVTVKNAYPDRWSSPLTYTSPWHTVPEKTTGTTQMAFRVFSGLGSSRDTTYTYQGTVDPAASALTVSDGTLGEPLEISIQKYEERFTHTYSYTCGSVSGTFTELPWTPPLELASQNPRGTEVAITLTLSTYSGETLVGSNSQTVTAAIPETVVPSLTVVVRDQTGIADDCGYVQHHSKFSISLREEGAYGAWITSREIRANGAVYYTAPVVTEVLKDSGDVTVTAKITDSRGRQTEKTVTVQVLAYTPPAVSISAVRRCDSTGATDKAGAYLNVIFSAKATKLGNANSCAISIRYKKAAETVWTTDVFPSYDDRFSIDVGWAIFPADPASSYNIELIMEDDFTSSNAIATGSSISKFMHWLKNPMGIAFGKVAEEPEVLDSAWVIRARQGLQLPNGTGGFVTVTSPAMEPGTEYLTGEQWKGKPVYCKVVDCGALPDSGIITVDTGIAPAWEIIRMTGTARDSTYQYTMPDPFIWLYHQGSQLCISTQGDYTGCHGTATVYYTKG